jgi:hypothetical protein
MSGALQELMMEIYRADKERGSHQRQKADRVLRDRMMNARSANETGMSAAHAFQQNSLAEMIAKATGQPMPDRGILDQIVAKARGYENDVGGDGMFNLWGLSR